MCKSNLNDNYIKKKNTTFSITTFQINIFYQNYNYFLKILFLFKSSKTCCKFAFRENWTDQSDLPASIVCGLQSRQLPSSPVVCCVWSYLHHSDSYQVYRFYLNILKSLVNLKHIFLVSKQELFRFSLHSLHFYQRNTLYVFKMRSFYILKLIYKYTCMTYLYPKNSLQ